MENNNHNESQKPGSKVYKAEVVRENDRDIYRERTRTIQEKEVVKHDRPRSSAAQMILAVCAFITISFAIFDKVIKPMLHEKKAQQTVVSTSGKIEAKMMNCKNNSKFILLDCFVTNKTNNPTVTFFNEGKLVDAEGKSTNEVFVQADGSKTFNISDKTEKEIELPNNVPVLIRIMYDIKTKEDITYASFNTSLGKIEFRDIVILE